MPIQLFRDQTQFDFMSKRWIGFVLSLILIASSIGVIVTKGLNLGIDFTGGILMEIHTKSPADLSLMRSTLSSNEFGEVSLQHSGSDNDVMIRIQVSDNDDQSAVVELAKQKLGAALGETIDYRKVDYVGPTVGKELIESGIIATLLSFAVIMLYVWFRFEWQYGFGAIFALIHDIILVLGFFAATRFDFGLPAVAAILTVIGYSINDSVVIFDRIRENLRRFKKMEIPEVLNISLNDTLSRTIVTGATTCLAGLSLYLFGGEVIAGFAAAIVFGVVVGTYSSVYIAAPTLLYLNIRESQLELEEA